MMTIDPPAMTAPDFIAHRRRIIASLRKKYGNLFRHNFTRRTGMPVRCVETGVIHADYLAATDWVRRHSGRHYSKSAIGTAINVGTSVGGFHFCWAYVAEPTKQL